MALGYHDVPNIARVPLDAFDGLSDGDRITIETAAHCPNFRANLDSIIKYSRLRVEHEINKHVVEHFLSLGISCFGTKVKEVKVHLIAFLERHIELRDADPTKCFWKVAYYFAYCSQNNLAFD